MVRQYIQKFEFEHLIVEEIGDLLAVQFLVRSEEQLHDLHRGLVGQLELAVRARVHAARLGGAAQRIVGIFLVEPVILVKYGNAFRLDGRNGAEQIPHHLEMVVHLAAAAHHIADAGNVRAVAGAARNRVLFEYVDVARPASARLAPDSRPRTARPRPVPMMYAFLPSTRPRASSVGRMLRNCRWNNT